jgi:pimeloyl-ACP methyl ester carboxylesterase
LTRPAAVLLAAALATGCADHGSDAPRRHARRVALVPCRVSGLPAQSQCGTVTVPEDRSAPGGRQIALRVAVLPALAPDPDPDPLVLLAGGPGQGAVEALGPLLPAFQRVRRKRDLVLVDQRGTGGSNPLDCRLDDEDTPLAERLLEEGFPHERLKACREGFGADVRQYGTPQAVADLEDVISALGYDRVNLWGASYGTRLALTFLREKPARVRSAVLDGVAPYDNRLPLYFAPDGQRALGLLFRHCAGDMDCSHAYPDLAARFQALLARLESRPVARFAHPATGEPVEGPLSRDAFVTALRGVLYAPDVAVLVPYTIDHASRGDFGPFAAQALALEHGFSRSLSLGLFFSVVCSEDVPFILPGEIERESAGTFVGPGQARELVKACEGWPRATLPPGWRDPVRSDIPVLLLSGELDPATPPRWAEKARETLSSSLHVVARGVGHGVTGQGCVPEIVDRFVQGGSVAGLQTRCVQQLRRPPFFVRFAGPEP